MATTEGRSQVALADGTNHQENGIADAELGSTPGGGRVTKILSKRDSVREVKKEEKQVKKDKKDKKESLAGLAPSEPRGSTGSCSSGGVAGDGSVKEVKFRDTEGGGTEKQDDVAGDLFPAAAPGSPKVPHKFISNWKHACDKTRDRTRDLLKRWRTAPEGMDMPGVGPGAKAGADTKQGQGTAQGQGQGWSVHVWATWVKRLPSEEEGFLNQDAVNSAALLTPVQRDKLSQFFTHLVDSDHDDLVSRQDFENLSERLRHFADWSDNSTEYHILREVEQSFVSAFLEQAPEDAAGLAGPRGERLCSLEQWLSLWGAILDEAKTFSELPVWLQFFPKVIFQVINKSGTGVVTRDELGAFYSSVLGLSAQRVGEILDAAYKALTANGDYPLCFPAYRWCYANFLLGRHRNGPGQYLFGPGESQELRDCPFPVDYSALNSTPEELEQYSPDRKSNRRSVVV